MPRITSTREKYEIDLNAVICRFAFNMEEDCVAYGLISERKFNKHILPADFDSARGDQEKAWHESGFGVIKPEGKKHTAITPAGFGAIRPLYELFARDFIREFQKVGEKSKENSSLIAWNAELEYTRDELGKRVPGGIDILNPKDSSLKEFQFLIVGATVKRLAARNVKQSPVAGKIKEDGTITIVYFQHGPYPSNQKKQ